MAEENLNFAEKIEKLILDGNKEVLNRIGNVEGGQKTILELIQRLDKKVDKIDKKHDINAMAQYDLMQDVKKDVRDVKEKLTEHMRQPAHA